MKNNLVNHSVNGKQSNNSGTCCIVKLDVFGGNANHQQIPQVGSIFESHLNIKDNHGSLILDRKRFAGKLYFLEIFCCKSTLSGICFFKKLDRILRPISFSGDELNLVFAFGPNSLTLHHFFLGRMYLWIASAKQHTCRWAFVLSEILCGRNQRSRVKTHIIFPPSLCNWSVTVSHRSRAVKGVHLQSDKSEKSDMFVGVCPSNLESLKWKKLFVLDIIPGPENIPLIESLQLLRYERDIH